MQVETQFKGLEYHRDNFAKKTHERLVSVFQNPYKLFHCSRYAICFDLKDDSIMGLSAYYDSVGDWYGNERYVCMLAIDKKYAKDRKMAQAICSSLALSLAKDELPFRYSAVRFFILEKDHDQLENVLPGLHKFNCDLYVKWN